MGPTQQSQTNSKTTHTSSQNGSGSDFNTRRSEFETATRGVSFTKDFNPSLEAVMNDPLETYVARVFAWTKRKAWGNQCLYCVNSDGSPAFQVDCVRELKIAKYTVCKAVNYLVRRGYLEMRGTAKVLYPVISPDPANTQTKGEDIKKLPAYATFLEDWKVAHSSDFAELEVARSTVERIRKVILTGYREWRASRTNPGPSLLKENSEVKEEEVAGKQASSVAVGQEHSLPTCPSSVENQNGNAMPEPSTVEKILALPEIQQLQVETGDCIDLKFATVIAANLRDGPVEKLGQAITERKKRGRISTGLLPRLAAGVARSNDIHKQTARDEADAGARQQQSQQSALIQQLLRDWDKTPKDDQQSARDTWPEVPWPLGRRT